MKDTETVCPGQTQSFLTKIKTKFKKICKNIYVILKTIRMTTFSAYICTNAYICIIQRVFTAAVYS